MTESFSLKIAVLLRATYLAAIGNNINSFASAIAFPTILRALLQVTSKADKMDAYGNRASCPWQ